MASSSKLTDHSSSCSKPPKFPLSLPSTSDPQSTPNSSFTSPITISHKTMALSRATHLTRKELLNRRSHNLKQLSRCYRDLYWIFMEELKIQFREYYWEYGVSPFRGHMGKHSEDREGGNVEGTGEINNKNNRNDSDVVNNQRCAFVGCKLKAMPLTSFCHLHILSDSKQRLYKPCNYVIKSAQAVSITCGKPILRSTVPSICTVHFQKAQKHLTRNLKRVGLNINSTSKLTPKFHVIVAQYIRHIQVKRRYDLRSKKCKIVVPEEKDSRASRQ